MRKRAPRQYWQRGKPSFAAFSIYIPSDNTHKENQKYSALLRLNTQKIKPY